MDMRLPDFLVIGPQKAGTTWIHRYLAARGDVCLPRGVKETFFFDRRAGEKPLKWYASHFSRCTNRQSATGEVAPTYFASKEAMARIKQDLGGIKVVCTLRDPAKRTWSLYLHMLRYGMTDKPFREALSEIPELLDTGRYAHYLALWQEAFGQDCVLVLMLEDLSTASESYTKKLCGFLGLPFMPVPEELARNINAAALPPSGRLASVGLMVADALRDMRLYGVVSLAKRLGLKSLFFGRPGKTELPELSGEDLAWLYEHFAPEVGQLEKMLKTELPAWKGK